MSKAISKHDKTNNLGEVLDLVSENDEITGEITKGEANKNPNIFHREVGIIIYDDKNRVLLQQRGPKRSVHPNQWTISCTGHIPKGVKPIETAHRELKEELGFDTEVRFVKKDLDKLPTESRFFYYFIGKYPESEIKLQSEEVAQVKWISQEEFKTFSKNNRVLDSSKKIIERFWREGWA